MTKRIQHTCKFDEAVVNKISDYAAMERRCFANMVEVLLDIGMLYYENNKYSDDLSKENKNSG